jgi:hypothetical protein
MTLLTEPTRIVLAKGYFQLFGLDFFCLRRRRHRGNSRDIAVFSGRYGYRATDRIRITASMGGRPRLYYSPTSLCQFYGSPSRHLLT